MTIEERAAEVELECTGVDGHGPGVNKSCYFCCGARAEIKRHIRAAVEEFRELACGAVCLMCRTGKTRHGCQADPEKNGVHIVRYGAGPMRESVCFATAIRKLRIE